MRKITKELLVDYRTYLIEEEKSAATQLRYTHDVEMFFRWLGDRPFDKEEVLRYKSELGARYAPGSVNTILSSLNNFFGFCTWYELRVKTVKIQKPIYMPEEKELTVEEYKRLLAAAKRRRNPRLYLLLQTICSTGIRVSEVSCITKEAIGSGKAEIRCKGKQRTVFLPERLCHRLQQYCEGEKIKSGPVFITKNGQPLNRSNIWLDMKKLCREANVAEEKAYPHNLRHLFARTYYSAQKDIVRLADILGHSSINTTRIYTMESGEIHRRQIQNLGLLQC